MSSYDVYFAARGAGAPPTVNAVRAWLEGRPGWKLEDATQAAYENPLTGVGLNATLYPTLEPDMAADLAPVCFWIAGLRPHYAIEEVSDEIAAFVDGFELGLADKEDVSKRAPFERASFADAYEQHNRRLHDVTFRYEGSDHPEVLERARLDEVFRWNRQRDALAERAGDELFVPQILFADRGERITTFVAWADGTSALVPKVDSIQTTRTHVPWSVIEVAIATARREADHWVVEGDALAAVFAAIERANGEPPPRIVEPRRVLTKELVAEYLLPPGVRERRKRAIEQPR